MDLSSGSRSHLHGPDLTHELRDARDLSNLNLDRLFRPPPSGDRPHGSDRLKLFNGPMAAVR